MQNQGPPVQKPPVERSTFEELGVRTGWEGDVFRTFPDPEGRRMRCATAIDGKKFAASFVEALRVL